MRGYYFVFRFYLNEDFNDVYFDFDLLDDIIIGDTFVVVSAELFHYYTLRIHLFFLSFEASANKKSLRNNIVRYIGQFKRGRGFVHR